MKRVGAEAIEAFRNMWSYWKETGNFPMEEYLSYYAKDFKGFDSGIRSSR